MKIKENQVILLIGGTGFIGKNLVNTLINSGHELVILVRNKGNVPKLFFNFSQIKVIEVSLNESDKIASIMDDFSVDLVIHMASCIVAGSDKNEFDSELLNVVLPTMKLLNMLSQKNIKIIFFSSGGTIYGNQSGSITEESELEPINYYGFSKLLLEQYILFLFRSLKLKYVIVRPSNVYGKLQNINETQGFVEVVTEKILNNKVIEIWGSGKQTRDFIHISDVCIAINKIVSQGISNKIINIACGKSYSLLEVIDILEKELNMKALLSFRDSREVDAKHIRFNIKYLRSELDYEPLNIYDGIKIFIKDYNKKYNT
jgi:UDP-glucose 4-epimerase